MARSRKTPTAKKISESTAQTIWEIRYPSTMSVQGGVYRATTYPNSDSLFLETWVKRRPVSNVVASRMSIEVREAIRLAAGANA